MIVSLIIILILYYFLFHSYFGKSLLSKHTEKVLRQNNIDVSSSSSVINSAKTVAGEANKRILKENKQIDSVLK